MPTAALVDVYGLGPHGRLRRAAAELLRLSRDEPGCRGLWDAYARSMRAGARALVHPGGTPACVPDGDVDEAVGSVLRFHASLFPSGPPDDPSAASAALDTRTLSNHGSARPSDDGYGRLASAMGELAKCRA